MQKNVDQASQPVITAKNVSTPLHGWHWRDYSLFKDIILNSNWLNIVTFLHVQVFKIGDLRSAYVLCATLGWILKHKMHFVHSASASTVWCILGLDAGLYNWNTLPASTATSNNFMTRSSGTRLPARLFRTILLNTFMKKSIILSTLLLWRNI